MKFKAININGKEVVGTGVTECKNKLVGLEGVNLMFLFTEGLEWYDGDEFHTGNFEVVFAESVRAEE